MHCARFDHIPPVFKRYSPWLHIYNSLKQRQWARLCNKAAGSRMKSVHCYQTSDSEIQKFSKTAWENLRCKTTSFSSAEKTTWWKLAQMPPPRPADVWLPAVLCVRERTFRPFQNSAVSSSSIWHDRKLLCSIIEKLLCSIIDPKICFLTICKHCVSIHNPMGEWLGCFLSDLLT